MYLEQYYDNLSYVLRYRVTELQSYRVTELQSYTVTELQSYRVTKLLSTCDAKGKVMDFLVLF
jgi:hypothetical protein